MFYNFEVLSKKGKLARVWLAAHYDKKLTKPQILSTDIVKAIDAIVGEEGVPMALRILGHLLLGIARLYARKSDYLLKDCNDAIVTIKLAFRPGVTGEKTGKKTNVATTGAITLKDPGAAEEADISLHMQDLGDITLNIDMDDMIPLSFDQPSNLHQASYANITMPPAADEPSVHSPVNIGDQLFDPNQSQTNDFQADPEIGRQDSAPLLPDIEPPIDVSVPDIGDISLDKPDISNVGEISNIEIEAPVPEEQPVQPAAEPGEAMEEDLLPPPMNIDPEADAADAAEAVPGPRAGRVVKVHTDSRTTTYSTEELREMILEAENLTREVRHVPVSNEELERLEFEISDVQASFPQLNFTSAAGVADELGDLFANFMNPTEQLDLPPMLPGDLLHINVPQTPPEQFQLPPGLGDFQDEEEQPEAPPADTTDFEIPPPEQPNISDLPGPFEPSDIPESPERGRRDSGRKSSKGGKLGDDSRFSVGPLQHSIDIPSGSQEEQTLVQHQSFSKRTSVMQKFLEKSFKDSDELSYQKLVENRKRATVAQTFFELLVLKSRNIIDLKQEEPYGEILITKTDNFAIPV